MSRWDPASFPGQPGTSRTIRRAVGVSSETSVTVPTSHAGRMRFTKRSPLCPLPIALFGPRVAVHVVPVLLPEPRLVVLRHDQATHPFGALPEVQRRHEQPGRPTVLGIERFTLGFGRN